MDIKFYFIHREIDMYTKRNGYEILNIKIQLGPFQANPQYFNTYCKNLPTTVHTKVFNQTYCTYNYVLLQYINTHLYREKYFY
jgi:hypothetical protein